MSIIFMNDGFLLYGATLGETYENGGGESLPMHLGNL